MMNHLHSNRLPPGAQGTHHSPSPLASRFNTSVAFTLIEVMLALAVSAIVLAAIGGVFYSAMRLRERTSAMLDESAPLHHALTVLRRDLQGALPPGAGTLPMAGDFISETMGG